MARKQPYVIRADAYEDGSVSILGRILAWDGDPAVQADISSITYTITNVDTGSAVTGHSAASLTAASVIFDTLQGSDGDDARWPESFDTTGYNFLHHVNIGSNAAFASAGLYTIEYVFTPASGSVFLVKVEVTAHPIRRS